MKMRKRDRERKRKGQEIGTREETTGSTLCTTTPTKQDFTEAEPRTVLRPPTEQEDLTEAETQTIMRSQT